jgi:hypothetical protein
VRAHIRAKSEDREKHELPPACLFREEIDKTDNKLAEEERGKREAGRERRARKSHNNDNGGIYNTRQPKGGDEKREVGEERGESR